jgi:hypothetical protein
MEGDDLPPTFAIRETSLAGLSGRGADVSWSSRQRLGALHAACAHRPNLTFLSLSFMICSEMEAPEPLLPNSAISDAPDAADAAARARIGRQLEILGRLAEVGLEVALAVERQVKHADLEPAALQHLAMAYSRTSRAVRMSIALQSRLIEDLQALDQVQDRARTQREEKRRERIERIVERIAQDAYEDDEIDELVRETSERLKDDDCYGGVMTRPIGELVALICRDLDLHPDWAKLAQESWARAEASVEGSPFKDLELARPPPVAAANAGADRTRPPPLAGEVAQRAGEGLPPPFTWVGACAATTFPSNGPDG